MEATRYGGPVARHDTLGARVRAAIGGTIITVVLFPFLLVINAAQTASLVVLPVSRRLFRAFNRGCADLWWGSCVFMSRSMWGSDIVLTGDSVPERESAVLVCNHQEMTDIAVLFYLAKQKKRLGDLKWFVKDPVKYVPGIGWGMLFLDCLFVKREWTRDRASVERTFARIVDDSVPLWLISFSEGTRITPDKHARSRSFAEERGLTPTEHVMVPRTKGFVASVQGLRAHADAVYDVTLGYPDGVPTLWQFICGYGRTTHVHVRRFPLDSLPPTDGELSDWLMERFIRKDALLAHLAAHGAFPAGAGDVLDLDADTEAA